MLLKEFINSIQQNPDLAGYFVCELRGKEFPSHFFSKLFAQVQSVTGSAASLDAEVVSLQDMKASLEMSFLGSRLAYFVKNTHLYDAAAKKAWAKYLQSYEGPHTIVSFTKTTAASKTAATRAATSVQDPDSDSSQTTQPTTLTIELPEKVDKHLYQALASFLYPGTSLDSSFLSQLFHEVEHIPLDDACLMMAYQSVVGRKCEAFFSDWFTRLMAPQQSFFTLSQYLLAQQPKLFLEQWQRCKSDLPDEFWVAYWSEQIWQAALFVQRAKTLGYAEARKGTYRLPFSFLNKDWQKHTLESLTLAHQRLYELDYNLKNGGTGNGVELWYHRFLKA